MAATRSSFVRRILPAAADPGTRPGLHGQTLISTGLTDLDKLLGGGLPLGTVLLIIEDAFSQQHLNLVKYFISEGLLCKQKVHWIAAAAPPGGPAQFLPAEAAPSASSAAAAAAAASTAPSSQAAEGEQGPELRIAWQYRKYIKDKPAAAAAGSSSTAAGGFSSSSSSSGGAGSGSAAASAGSSFQRAGSRSAVEAGLSRQWCRSYDLTRSLGEERLRQGSLDFLLAAGPDPLQQACASSLDFLARVRAQPGAPPPRGPQSVGRLVLQSLGSVDWLAAGSTMEQQALEQQMARLVLRVKLAAQSSRSAAVITCHTGTFSPSVAQRLVHMCDAVLRLESAADDSMVVRLLQDSQAAAALLHLHKLPSVGMLGPRLPDNHLYVIRHLRRKISITPVEVDPDAEAGSKASDAAAGGLGSGQAAKLMCGGPVAASKSLEF